LVARVTTDASSGPVQAQNRQAAGSVLIVGVGAVGSTLAWQLARLGVRLRLIDKGVLGPTNLVWHQAGTDDLGQPKAVVLADHIRQRLPQCQVDGFEVDFIELDDPAVQEHLAWADVIVAATDDVQVQGCINRDCLAAGKPTVFPAVWVDDVSHESEAGEILWVDPRRGVMPCYECLTQARDLALAAQPGERGGHINVEELILTLTTMVKGLINPIDPAARFLWEERSLVRVRGHEPLRPTLVHDFGEGQYVSPVDVRFPPQPCRACGQQAPSVSPEEPPPDTAPVDEPPGGTVPHPEWSIPPVGYARNLPVDQSDNHLPTDNRAITAAAVTVIIIVALAIAWAVLSAVNRHHAAAAAAPSGQISPPGSVKSPRAKTASISVPADAQGGVNAGIYARKGDTIMITGSGSAGYGYEGTEGCVGNPITHPDGSRYLDSFNCGPKDDPDAVLSGAAIGQLIARIGDGAWFGVGSRTTVTAGGSGYIYLAYNDSAYSDNTGSYSATITNNGTGPVASPSAKPRASQSSPAWTSPASFRITYPADMTIACAQQFGQGAYAQLANEDPPSYDVVCIYNGSAHTGLDLDEFCPWLARHEHYRSPNGPDGWWSGNPKRSDANISDRPWLDWRCYNAPNPP
jgi:hypothetical protein